VCRRALRLFAVKAAALPAELEQVARLPGVGAKEREERARALAAAALQVRAVTGAGAAVEGSRVHGVGAAGCGVAGACAGGWRCCRCAAPSRG